ncbi:MAG: putative sporulation protein YtxC, partial [Bacillota bacterium]
MAGKIVVSGSRYMGQLKKQLLRYLRVCAAEATGGRYTLLTCVADRRVGRARLKRRIAAVVAKLVVQRWEEGLLENMVAHDCPELNADERRLIVQRVRRHRGARKLRQELVRQRAEEVLETHNGIVIDGFVRFRLHDYLEGLRAAAYEALNDYLLEKEYHQFIRLLRSFVEVRQGSCRLIHVVCRADGRFQLLDRQKQTIGAGATQAFLEDEAGDDEILISTLVALAPREVVLHRRTGYERPAWRIIGEVFRGRLRE